MKGLCVIIGASELERRDLPEKREGDLWIAADGGKDRLAAFGLSADVFIGDLDSAENAPEAGEAVVLPRRKDDTDTAFAVKYALERGYREFLLLGALGGARLSHTAANLQLLSFIRANGAFGTAVSGGVKAFCLLPGESASVFGSEGYFSVFALTEKAAVDIRGALFNGEGLIIGRDFPLGVSNEPAGEANILIRGGEALIVTENVTKCERSPAPSAR